MSVPKLLEIEHLIETLTPLEVEESGKSSNSTAASLGISYKSRLWLLSQAFCQFLFTIRNNIVTVIYISTAIEEMSYVHHC